MKQPDNLIKRSIALQDAEKVKIMFCSSLLINKFRKLLLYFRPLVNLIFKLDISQCTLIYRLWYLNQVKIGAQKNIKTTDFLGG